MQNAFPQVPAGTLSLRLSLTSGVVHHQLGVRTISSGYVPSARGTHRQLGVRTVSSECAPSARGTHHQLGVRTSRSWVMLARFGVPAWRMIEASSRFRMSMTASTPG
jgi:hypothetical protein